MIMGPTRAENKFASKLRDVSIFTNGTRVLYGSSLYIMLMLDVTTIGTKHLPRDSAQCQRWGQVRYSSVLAVP